MAHTLIITAYNPDLTPKLKSWIKKNITPSMVNIDGDEKSYFLQSILDEEPILSVEDNILIKDLINQNVEYVEF